MTKEKLPKCHVCGKDKEPYEVWIKNDLHSLMRHADTYDKAREGGEICQRCDSYYYMTGILKPPTEVEFEEALAKAKSKSV